MSDYHAFLRHLLESPRDEVARLVFADWLEERDQPYRAEFIRVSVRWANAADEDERQALEARRDQLQADHWAEVTGGLPNERSGRYHFDLGLPTRVNLTGAEAIALGDAIFAAYPIPRINLTEISRLAPDIYARSLTGIYSYAHEIAARSWLKHLQEMDLPRDPPPHSYEVGRILRSPHLTNLRRLDLRGLGEVGVLCEALSTQSRMHRLRSITLSGCGVHIFALRSLCECPSLANVEELDLSDNPLTDSAGVTLTRCRFFKRLKSLNLSQPGHLSKPMRKRLRRHFGETLIL